MTNRNLGRQWFHGSPEDLQPGDTIHPPSVTGKAQTRSDGKPDRVYVTPYEFVAAQYTWHPDQFGTKDTEPRGHVYEVEPHGRTTKDPNAPKHMDVSYEAKAAVVKRRLDPKEWR